MQTALSCVLSYEWCFSGAQITQQTGSNENRTGFLFISRLALTLKVHLHCVTEGIVREQQAHFKTKKQMKNKCAPLVRKFVRNKTRIIWPFGEDILCNLRKQRAQPGIELSIRK